MSIVGAFAFIGNTITVATQQSIPTSCIWKNNRINIKSKDCLGSMSQKSRLFSNNNDDDSDDINDSNKKEEEDEIRSEMFENIMNEFLEQTSSSSSSDNENSDFPTTFLQPKSTSKSIIENTKNLYSDDELSYVLSTHQQLEQEFPNDEEESNNNDDISTPSMNLHDLILKTIDEVDKETANTNGDIIENDNNSNEPYQDEITQQTPKATSKMTPNTSNTVFEMTPDLQQKINDIRVIASDLDGTILSSQQTVVPRTYNAIERLLRTRQETGKLFFPATGKSKKGAWDSLGTSVTSLLKKYNVPGVYIQGLYCVDGNDNVIYEEKLNIQAISEIEKLLLKYPGMSIVAYDGDVLYTTEQTDIVIHLHEHYGEPLARLLSSNLASHETSMHKLLIMSSEEDKDTLTEIIRPQLEQVAATYGACITQAIPTMLEVLPAGCSKAKGVRKLCEALGIDNPEKELLAIGDAENDAGMLEMASIGVAVGNASPKAIEAADYVLKETNDEGGAGVAMEVFGLGEY